jgi:hypothetical protein
MTIERGVSHLIYSPLSKDVEGFDSLVELALAMRWSWNHATEMHVDGFRFDLASVLGRDRAGKLLA